MVLEPVSMMQCDRYMVSWTMSGIKIDMMTLRASRPLTWNFEVLQLDSSNVSKILVHAHLLAMTVLEQIVNISSLHCL